MTGLSFVCAGGPCQRSLSRVLVPWDLQPYFTVSNLRLPFSSPPTTCRVTVEVFDPASTRVSFLLYYFHNYGKDLKEVTNPNSFSATVCLFVEVETCLATRYPASDILLLLEA
jgi:hypothetical protein